MFKWMTEAVLNDDEHDMTEVPKQSLNAILHYLFYLYRSVMFAFNQFE